MSPSPEERTLAAATTTSSRPSEQGEIWIACLASPKRSRTSFPRNNEDERVGRAAPHSRRHVNEREANGGRPAETDDLCQYYINTPEVWDVDPRSPKPTLMHHFNNATGQLLWLASYLMYTSDCRHVPVTQLSGGSLACPATLFVSLSISKRVAPEIASARFLNGLTAFPQEAVLASDCQLGAIISTFEPGFLRS